MLSDVVSPASYLTFNVTIAHIIGLVNSVYCSELLDIYNKARKKKRIDEDGFFVVNRDYIKTMTSIKIDDQYLCDASLSKIGLIKNSKDNPDRIKFDISKFMQIIAEDDSKILNQIYKKVTIAKNDRDSEILKRDKKKFDLKSLIDSSSVKISNALKEWVDVIFESQVMNKDAVIDFQDKIKAYSEQDALRIITIAKINCFVDVVSAIDKFNQEQKVLAKTTKVRTSSIKVADATNMSDKKF